MYFEAILCCFGHIRWYIQIFPFGDHLAGVGQPSFEPTLTYLAVLWHELKAAIHCSIPCMFAPTGWWSPQGACSTPCCSPRSTHPSSPCTPCTTKRRTRGTGNVWRSGASSPTWAWWRPSAWTSKSDLQVSVWPWPTYGPDGVPRHGPVSLTFRYLSDLDLLMGLMASLGMDQ